ncbi:MAG: hypothetical protein KAJ18_11075 [Candidatus Omnitrophica bacterium]|nr:hypothetical protein [Candidatus Omnitrophota bacterium]
MKLNIFYSWQSDLPNNTNRGLIGDCLEKSLKNIYKKNNSVSEYIIESDSRDESGTPDIVSNIFSKIDKCDIFIGDISIINNDYSGRMNPNPNVLIELGYASSIVGWENILCVFNDDFGRKEELPFDIRFRKPIGYSTTNNRADAKKALISKLERSIQEIIDNRLSSKKFYNAIKREVDLGLQAILFDFLKILYFTDPDSFKRLDYNRLLHLSVEEITEEIENKDLLGFQLFKNQEQNVSDFKEFFNDNSKMHFLNSKEKNILAQIIMLLRDIKRIFNSSDVFEEIKLSENYSIVSGHEMNSENPQGSLILLENIDAEKGIVRDSGTFETSNFKKLKTLYKVKSECLRGVAHTIKSFTIAINDWIRETGGVFIFNHREIMDSSKTKEK